MIAHLDCPTGIAGDMFLGALLDAGLAEDSLREAVEQLGVAADAVRISRVSTHGLAAVSVRVSDEATAGDSHRAWRDIRESLEGSALPEAVLQRALATFERLAHAEANVHGCDVQDVCFHEVGAVDSIVDIVGVCLGLEALGIERLTCSALPLGSGTVDTHHGPLPVPAPATIELLRDVPISGGQIAGELTTPTGAALLRANAISIGVPLPPMVPRAIGYGAGTRDIGIPNAARLIVGTPDRSSTENALEAVTLLETNLDHLTPEMVASVASRFLEAGALDVWQTPIVMKKGRSAVTLSVLCRPDAATEMAESMLRESGSLGVRRLEMSRHAAPRDHSEVETPWGRVRVKVSEAGGVMRTRPEHEDVSAIANETGIPVDRVGSHVTRLAEDALTRTREGDAGDAGDAS